MCQEKVYSVETVNIIIRNELPFETLPNFPSRLTEQNKFEKLFTEII